jgi:tetratricopeptide (TPR) repeat protein
VRHLLVASGLCLATVLAYSNSFQAGFPLDNKGLILQDPRLRAATRENITLILEHTYWWPYGESGLYRPATTLSYLLNYAVLGNGDRPAGYHAVNLLLQTLNVLLAYLLMLRLTRDGRASAAIAAVWAVHPLSVEAVTNIVGRADLLAALAVLSGFLLYLQSTDARGVRRLAWLAGLAAVTAIGLFSKESAVVIVGVIVLYEFTWRFPRRLPAFAWGAAALVPPFLVFWYHRAAVIGAAVPAEFPFVDNPITGASAWTGRLTAIGVMARYLRLLVWPASLSADYSYPAIPLARGSAEDWVGWIAVAAVVVATIVLFRRQRTGFFCSAFALVTFLPASNLLFPTGTIMAERLMYLPSLGLVALLVLGVFAVCRRFGHPAIALVLIAGVAAGLGYRTWTRNFDWRDDESIWTATVRTSPQSAKAHRALAEALYAADSTHGNLDRVIAEASAAVERLAPLPARWKDLQSYRQLAAYHLDRGDLLRTRDDRTAATGSLIDYRASVSLLRECLVIIAAARPALLGGSEADLSPGSGAAQAADVYRLMSAAYVRLGDSDEAIDAATRGRTFDPLNPASYGQTASALVGASQDDLAAMWLLTGFMVTGNAGLRQAVVDAYGGAPIDRSHSCAASAEAMRIHLQLGRRDLAEAVKRNAIASVGCPADPLVRILP